MFDYFYKSCVKKLKFKIFTSTKRSNNILPYVYSDVWGVSQTISYKRRLDIFLHER